MRKFLVLASVIAFTGCSKFSDADVVLTTTSLFGSPVHLATFNGNSASKSEDCQLMALLLNEKYPGRYYVCQTYKEMKKDL